MFAITDVLGELVSVMLPLRSQLAYMTWVVMVRNTSWTVRYLDVLDSWSEGCDGFTRSSLVSPAYWLLSAAADMMCMGLKWVLIDTRMQLVQRGALVHKVNRWYETR